jgi:hypothetical protein
LIPKKLAFAKAGVADFSDKIIRKIAKSKRIAGVVGSTLSRKRSGSDLRLLARCGNLGGIYMAGGRPPGPGTGAGSANCHMDVRAPAQVIPTCKIIDRLCEPPGLAFGDPDDRLPEAIKSPSPWILDCFVGFASSQ